MKNPQTIVIVCLAASAAILGGMLAGVSLSQAAQAGYSSVTYGDYIMVPYAWTDSLDLIVVIDVATRKMNIYVPNKQAKTLEPLQPTVDLERVFAD
jgi:hypothetical protein